MRIVPVLVETTDVYVDVNADERKIPLQFDVYTWPLPIGLNEHVLRIYCNRSK